MNNSKFNYIVELENLIKTNNLIVLLNCSYCPFLNFIEYMFGDLKISYKNSKQIKGKFFK